jgi:DNA (cytosine-5)-methyltransferase 1
MSLEALRKRVNLNATSGGGIPFVDLFSGAGGLSAGFEMAGFRSVFANDNDELACQTYRRNHPRSHVSFGNVENITASQILDSTGLSNVPLVIGGPNCQGVSLRGKRNPDDPKNTMFSHFKRLVNELKPEWFVMENVPGLLHRHNMGLLTSILSEFASIGYTCGGEVLLAADYGVPQLRYRFILIGNRIGQQVVFPNPTHRCPVDFTKQLRLSSARDLPPWVTVGDAISDLPPLQNGGGEENVPYPDNCVNLTEYQRMCRNGSSSLLNHVCHKSCNSNIEFIKHIPPGKNWKSIPEGIRPERFKRVALKDHTTTYRRLEWNMPARTITTYFNNISAGAFTHPEQHRGLSIREGARLQGFPDRFVFTGTLARQYRQVGNAVPPYMITHLAKIIHSHMSSGYLDSKNTHPAAVGYREKYNDVMFYRPLKGMRFNLDQHLITAY